MNSSIYNYFKHNYNYEHNITVSKDDIVNLLVMCLDSIIKYITGKPNNLWLYNEKKYCVKFKSKDEYVWIDFKYATINGKYELSFTYSINNGQSWIISSLLNKQESINAINDVIAGISDEAKAFALLQGYDIEAYLKYLVRDITPVH